MIDPTRSTIWSKAGKSHQWHGMVLDNQGTYQGCNGHWDVYAANLWCTWCCSSKATSNLSKVRNLNNHDNPCDPDFQTFRDCFIREETTRSMSDISKFCRKKSYRVFDLQIPQSTIVLDCYLAILASAFWSAWSPTKVHSLASGWMGCQHLDCFQSPDLQLQARLACMWNHTRAAQLYQSQSRL